MKTLFSILIFLTISNFSLGQKRYKAFFYPELVLINGITQLIDTTKAKLISNSTNRVIIWQNDLNKVSVLYKIKSTNKKLITKARTEIYKKGQWEKAPLKVSLLERRSLIITRWTSSSTSDVRNSRFIQVLDSKFGFPVKKSFIGDNGDRIDVNGYFEFIEK